MTIEPTAELLAASDAEIEDAVAHAEPMLLRGLGEDRQIDARVHPREPHQRRRRVHEERPETDHRRRELASPHPVTNATGDRRASQVDPARESTCGRRDRAVIGTVGAGGSGQ